MTAKIRLARESDVIEIVRHRFEWAIARAGRLTEGQWIAVYGCGGVGLSAIMIARAVGARIVAIDISDDGASSPGVTIIDRFD